MSGAKHKKKNDRIGVQTIGNNTSEQKSHGRGGQSTILAPDQRSSDSSASVASNKHSYTNFGWSLKNNPAALWLMIVMMVLVGAFVPPLLFHNQAQSTNEKKWNWTPESTGQYLLSSQVTDKKKTIANLFQPYQAGNNSSDITLSAQPDSLQSSGQIVTLTVNTVTQRQIGRYKFYSLKLAYPSPGNPVVGTDDKWEVVQDRDGSNKCSWTPTKDGNYLLLVTGNPGDNDTYISALLTYKIGKADSDFQLTASSPSATDATQSLKIITSSTTNKREVNYQLMYAQLTLPDDNAENSPGSMEWKQISDTEQSPTDANNSFITIFALWCVELVAFLFLVMFRYPEPVSGFYSFIIGILIRFSMTALMGILVPEFYHDGVGSLLTDNNGSLWIYHGCAIIVTCVIIAWPLLSLLTESYHHGRQGNAVKQTYYDGSSRATTFIQDLTLDAKEPSRSPQPSGNTTYYPNKNTPLPNENANPFIMNTGVTSPSSTPATEKNLSPRQRNDYEVKINNLISQVDVSKEELASVRAQLSQLRNANKAIDSLTTLCIEPGIPGPLQEFVKGLLDVVDLIRSTNNPTWLEKEINRIAKFIYSTPDAIGLYIARGVEKEKAFNALCQITVLQNWAHLALEKNDIHLIDPLPGDKLDTRLHEYSEKEVVWRNDDPSLHNTIFSVSRLGFQYKNSTPWRKAQVKISVYDNATAVNMTEVASSPATRVEKKTREAEARTATMQPRGAGARSGEIPSRGAGARQDEMPSKGAAFNSVEKSMGGAAFAPADPPAGEAPSRPAESLTRGADPSMGDLLTRGGGARQEDKLVVELEDTLDERHDPQMPPPPSQQLDEGKENSGYDALKDAAS